MRMLQDYQKNPPKGMLAIEQTRSYKKIYVKKILKVDVHGLYYETAEGLKGFIRLGMIGGMEEVPE